MKAEPKFERPAAMTIDGFCRWAGIGRSLTYKEIAAGRLRSVKVGKRRLIKLADALEWLQALS
ncbi:excisionase family DNA-binding protein [Mesorhizobium sp. AaZ16]|uniref:excisionase family DNA-binding protein n=1 Tax=Mesorhizobium sp. AaZ16 TaxID=3402289 RepID=UPI00374E4365